MAHGEAHRFFDGFHLEFLEELDEEAAAEVQDEERRDHQAARSLFFAGDAVNDVKRSEYEQTENDFVQLARMAIGRIGILVEAGKAHTPGLIGDLADNLRIEEIADADQSGSECRSKRKSIHPFHVGDSAPLSEKPHREKQAHDGAVTRKSAGPDLQNPDRVGECLFVVVKDYVAYARADEYSEHAVDEEVARVFVFATATHDLPAQQGVTTQKHCDEDKAVVPKLV